MNMRFERYEIKYRLTDEQYRALLPILAEHLVDDRYRDSVVCSVYYDTPDRRLIRRSMEKPLYKEKLRLRSYGLLSPQGNVFAELKKKYDGVVYKRRMLMPLNAAERFFETGVPIPTSQVGKELAYAVAYYGGLEPSMFLCYDREAFVGKDDRSLRVTFDRNIRARSEQIDLTSSLDGRLLLPPDERLMEVKTSGALPIWLCAALSSLHIYKTSFSKYGTAYADERKVY